MTLPGTRSSGAVIPTARSCSHARRIQGESAESMPRRVLDFGGFTELAMHGRWLTAPGEYVEGRRRYAGEIRMLEDHQRRTVATSLELRERGPELYTSQLPRGWTCKSVMHAPIRLRTTTLGRLTP